MQKKMEDYQIYKNYYHYFKLLQAFGEFTSHNHTILINEYQPNYDALYFKTYYN